ncbi:unnamed protein product [Calypogeia fissa]
MGKKKRNRQRHKCGSATSTPKKRKFCKLTDQRSPILGRPLLQCTNGSSREPRPVQKRVRRELLTNTGHHPGRIPSVSSPTVTFPTVIDHMGDQQKTREHDGFQGLAENCEFEVPRVWATAVEEVNDTVRKVLQSVVGDGLVFLMLNNRSCNWKSIWMTRLSVVLCI